MSKARSNSQDDFTPSGNIAATTRLLALQELDTEKFGKNTILGTVSQSAGVPTGAIIENGSNANGEYTKFADGTLICRGSKGYNASPITFPATFSANPFVQLTNDDSSISVSSANSVSTSGVSFLTNAAANTVKFIAAGRWF